MGQTRIMFLFANPDSTDKLALGSEFSIIYEDIDDTGKMDDFKLRIIRRTSLAQLQDELYSFRPHIVHFSGHALETGSLVFEQPDGKRESAPFDAIASVFGNYNAQAAVPPEQKIRLVVLSACYSETQAKEIAKHVECVIGMRTEVYDDVATTFASALYQNIAQGADLKTAFGTGVTQVKLLYNKLKDNVEKGEVLEENPQLIGDSASMIVFSAGKVPPRKNLEVKVNQKIKDAANSIIIGAKKTEKDVKVKQDADKLTDTIMTGYDGG